MAVNWKNEWNNSAYEKASSQVIAKDKKTYDREADRKRLGYNEQGLGLSGGIGGATAGALIGTAILPGLGTLLGAIFGGILGWGHGSSKETANRNRYEAYLDKTLDAKEDLTDSYNNYVDKWNLATKQQLENLNATNEELQATANATIESRDQTLETNANALYEQGQMYITQLEQMQVSNNQREGKALQNLATSGFRNSGTASNNLAEIQRAYDREYNLEKSKVQLSQYQNIVEAGNAYKSGTYTAYGYMGNVVDNNRKFNQFMEEQEMLYKQAQSSYEKETKRYEQDLKDLSDTQWEATYTWDSFMDIFSFGLNFVGVGK